MLKNFYILKINNKKDLKKLIKYQIYIDRIIDRDNQIVIYVDNDNYYKVLKYKKIYNIELIGIKGINRYKYILNKYYLFFIGIILGLIVVFFLSNIIFNVEIMTNDNEIKNIINKELDYYKLKKYYFVKSYQEKENIKKNILNDNKDTLEWIEITRVGTKYIVNVERRVINQKDDEYIPRDVVARKNAVILDIKADNGNIIRKINDYVNKGEIIVTGTIMKNDKIVNYVRANALVYGETWYNVNVEMPINYYSKIYTGRIKKRIIINFLTKKWKLFNFTNYLNEEVNDYVVYENKLLPINLSYATIKEIELVDDIYTSDKAIVKAIDIAKDRLLKTLPSDSKILSQKKLKLVVKDSKIMVDVFFKVYENITTYQNIVMNEE